MENGMRITSILAVLVGLLAIVQFFFDKAKWSIVSKFITLIFLAFVSMTLLFYDDISMFVTGSNNNSSNSTTSVSSSSISSKTQTRLDSINVVNADGVYLREDQFEDSFGNTYKQELIFDYDNSSIIFSPLGDFSYFKATLAIGSSEPEVDAKHTIEIFADDESIYSVTLLKTDEPLEIDININNARQLKIVADRHVIIGNGFLYND